MEDDADLQAIRARRMAEMQQQMGGDGGGKSAAEQQQAQEELRARKNAMLSQVLDQQARARLNTIALTKPEKAQMVENMLIQMAQSGQIQSKYGEEQLKTLLARVSEQTQKTTTVKFDRRRAALDSDDDM